MAILVVAGACVYIFVLDKDKGGDEPVADHYEILRDPQVGDMITLGYKEHAVIEQIETGSAKDFLNLSFYYKSEGTPSGEQSVDYKRKSYLCQVYDKGEDSGKYYVIQESGIVLKQVRDVRTLMLDDTNLDLTATIGEQPVSVGSFYHYPGERTTSRSSSPTKRRAYSHTR